MGIVWIYEPLLISKYQNRRNGEKQVMRLSNWILRNTGIRLFEGLESSTTDRFSKFKYKRSLERVSLGYFMGSFWSRMDGTDVVFKELYHFGPVPRNILLKKSSLLVTINSKSISLTMHQNHFPILVLWNLNFV